MSRGTRLSAIHTLCLQDILLCKNLSNKYHGSVIYSPVRLITFGLISYEELPLALCNQILIHWSNQYQGGLGSQHNI